MWGCWAEIRDPDEAWRAIAHPTLARGAAAAASMLCAAALLAPSLLSGWPRLSEPAAFTIVSWFVAMGVLALFARGIFHRSPTLGPALMGAMQGSMLVVDMTAQDFRAECICFHGAHLPWYILAAVVGSAIGGVLGWAGLAAVARINGATDARDLGVLPSALAHLGAWLVCASVVAFAAAPLALGVATLVAATIVLGAMLVTRATRHRFARAVAEGEIADWTIDDAGFLVVTVEPTASPYRAGPENVRVARVGGRVRRLL